ncbi:molybdate ABC transporter substrate-binding protein [Paenibacillus sp. GSMTC-2017]|uniref:molybdate ABC transporter substrate-binding protein n=1 Tax=Paenibacillus sp. GSMTC-2017 TaxID=2794350 RepID=UPI0018D78C83|nr:molybdate ABC transporter substrate-binding protein [Paenibacillus sp. GSMTC-2017]MBH5320440.1 molybdate ABC transporter substrate-binding protein [Paenibacillus sp. GSMTC-2017]
MKFFKKGVLLVTILVMAFTMSACGSSKDSSVASGEKVELTISAAASLTDALNELELTFEKEYKTIDLVFNYGASGALQQQIEQGAPADIFLSAAVKNMKTLVEKGLVENGKQRNLLSNELVVVVPKDGMLKLAELKDLLQEGVKKIAIGIPESVPAGSYAKEALVSASIWDQVGVKTVQAKDVRGVLQYVETGNVDAGFVYKTDALASKAVSIAFPVDPATYSPVLYPVGIVKATKHADEAQNFYEFLQTKEATDVFVKYGFNAAK